MKRKDLEKLHQLNVQELREKLVQVRKEIIDLRMSAEREKTKDVKLIGKKRDELARMMTILKEKEFFKEAKEADEKV